MLGLAFLFGGISSVAALIIEAAAAPILNNTLITLPHIINSNISEYVGFAIVEEVAKFLFIYLLVRKSPYFDEPIDAMIYLITGALGFATVENVLIALSGGGTQIFGTMLSRFIGATLLHALTAGIIGHFWARGIKFKMESRFVFGGLVMASIFHATFNILVVQFSDILIYPTVFLGLIGFFVLYDFQDLRKIEEIEERAKEQQVDPYVREDVV